METSSSHTASAAMPRPLQRSNGAASTARARIHPDAVVRKTYKHRDPDGSTPTCVNTNSRNTAYPPIIQTDLWGHGAGEPLRTRRGAKQKSQPSGARTTTDMVSQRGPVGLLILETGSGTRSGNSSNYNAALLPHDFIRLVLCSCITYSLECVI